MVTDIIFSLIMATKGRTKEISEFLHHLSNQSFNLDNLELIIVDQNDKHSDLSDIIKPFKKKINIIHIRSDKHGLSFNRNIGLNIARGKYLGFPDDDCFYSNNVLEEIFTCFDTYQSHLVLLNCTDPISNITYISQNEHNITRKNIMKYSISYNIFVMRNNIVFDEELGVGAYFSSGEETDYLWQYINSNTKIMFAKNSYVYHIQGGYGHRTYIKGYKYGLGLGAIFKKEIMIRKNYRYSLMYISSIIRSIGGIILTKNRKQHLGALLGRLIGFIKYKSKHRIFK